MGALHGLHDPLPPSASGEVEEEQDSIFAALTKLVSNINVADGNEAAADAAVAREGGGRGGTQVQREAVGSRTNNAPSKAASSGGVPEGTKISSGIQPAIVRNISS